MEAGKRIVLEKKNFLEGNPNDFESFLRGKMAEEASLELKEDAPRAEVLESEDGIYRLRRQSGTGFSPEERSIPSACI